MSVVGVVVSFSVVLCVGVVWMGTFVVGCAACDDMGAIV